MNKKTTAEKSPWDEAASPEVETVEAVAPKETKKKETKSEPVKYESDFDMEGLMTDFPNATELQKFVYDQTGIVLNLKGRANKVKYQVALDCLNGIEPQEQFVGSENPYIDKNDLVPTDPYVHEHASDPIIATYGPEVNVFDTNLFPHPDPDLKAQGQNCQVRFCKYANGAITYEILGPVTQRAVGERVNKYGKLVPEKYKWIDPRTGEQVIVRGDGTLTPLGTKIRGFMRRQRMNNSNMWDVWVDRDFIVKEDFIIDNPWAQV